MAVSTIANKQNFTSTVVTYALGIIGVGLVVFFGGEVVKNLDNLRGKAGLSVQTLNSEADIYINDNFVGKTPYESNTIKPGKNKLVLKSAERQYQTNINFISNNKNFLHVVGIVRDLGVSETFSSGQEFWFEKDDSGNVLRVVTEPDGAKVLLDGTEIGTTPFLSNNLSDGDYELEVSLPGYETQTTRINIKKGYVLNAAVKLFPMPIPQPLNVFEGSTGFYNLTTSNETVAADTQDWVKAVIYWNETRGISLGDTGANKEQVFDFYIDYKGNIFDAEGTLISSKEEFEKLKKGGKSAYLGKASDGDGLTKQARETLEVLNETALIGKTAKVVSTPTGWLRVRTEPNLNGTELARVDSGGTYTVLEEGTGWVKIRVSETVEGWVSSEYVELSE